MINPLHWKNVNQDLIAKAIGEMTFEQILFPEEKNGAFELKLHSGVSYSFEGWRSVWDHLRIVPGTIKRNAESALSAGQFFIDAQKETAMDDLVLGNFLEEMHNTLYSDLRIQALKDAHLSSEIVDWNGDKIQTILNGHPKILLNKGRMGWGANDLHTYAPEAERPFQLHWIAVRSSLLQGLVPEPEIIDESFDKDAKKELQHHLEEKKISLDHFTLLPVHPWQWDRYIQIQFVGLIQRSEVHSLGPMGDFYLPQTSVRTLSNHSRPGKLDIKLPLTILNTSCIRGIPARSISLGPLISKKLQTICTEDSFLKKSGTSVLLEKAGVALLHPLYSQVKEAPYRYHEYLGAIWRESPKEDSILTASLFFQDREKKSLIGEYIKRSGLTPESWLKEYFKVVVLPLYHLQLHYGIGMVAHGQNIVLKIQNYVPVGILLKDFQGDFRLSDELPELGSRYFADLKNEITNLPPHYLIHDLITGHFITVLRFISEVMQESDSFSEKDFYAVLTGVIQEYTMDKKISPAMNLLTRTIPRVLLNKVRFAIGYADSSERPLPLIGTDLQNPLWPEIGKK